MKAILKSDRKVIVDVVAIIVDPLIGINGYRDTDGNIYKEDELDWVEYYGG